MSESRPRLPGRVRPTPVVEPAGLADLVAAAGEVGVVVWAGNEEEGEASPQLVAMATPWGSVEALWERLAARLTAPAPVRCDRCGDHELRGEAEVQIEADDGPRLLQVRFAGHLHEPGRPAAASLCLVRDMTTQRHLEERLRRTEADAAEAVGQLLSNISHELRTPLTAILGMIELAMDTELTDRQQEYLRTIGSSAEVLLHLVYQVLDLTKVEAGQVSIEDEPFVPRRLVRGVLDLVRRRAEEKGLALGAEISPELPERLRGDPYRLRQILVNLVSNAVGYTTTGEVVVRVTTRPAAEDAVDVHFAVEDTGPGIARALQERVFERFFQVDTSTSRSSGGAGLGLAIANGLTGLMGGRLWLESAPGQGSTFHLELTFRAAAAEEADDAETAPPSPRPAAATRSLRVLVVEDNPDNRNLITWILEGAGATADVAENGERGLAKALDGSYDLVLMDVQMPAMDGFEATQRLRRAERERGSTRVPVVALTAHATQGFRERCLATGMDYYVTKPTTRARLLEVVERWADRSPRVLVVDDDPARRHALAELLHELRPELRLIAAADSREAFHTLAEVVPDLLLVDAGTADPDPASLVGVLRELPGHRGTPVVVVTDAAADDLEVGEIPVLQRPLDPARLGPFIEALPGAVRKPPDEPNEAGAPDPSDANGAAATDRIVVRPDPELADLVPEFLERRRAELRELGGMLEAADLDALRRLGHNLKGSGTPYGFDGLSRLGGELEQAAKAGDLDAARRTACALADYLERVEVRT